MHVKCDQGNKHVAMVTDVDHTHTKAYMLLISKHAYDMQHA